MTTYFQVSTTVPTRDDAIGLARSAVKEGLAAAAHVVGPVIAMSWHEGEYVEGEEWQIFFKTTEGRYNDLEDCLLDQHAWNNAEVTATAIVAGAADYLTWLERTVEIR